MNQAKLPTEAEDYLCENTHDLLYAGEKALSTGNIKTALLCLLKSLRISRAKDTETRVKIAEFAFSIGLIAEASTIYSHALFHDPNLASAQKGALLCLLASGREHECAEYLENRIKNNTLSIEFAEICMDPRLFNTIDLIRIRKLRREVVLRWPDHPSIPVRQRHLTPEYGKAKTLAQKGLVKEAISILENDTPPVEQGALKEWTKFKLMLASMPDDSQLQRSVVTNFMTSEIIISEPCKDKKVIILFGGLSGGVGMPAHLIDRLLASLGWQAVYITDFQRYGFMNGLESEKLDFDQMLSNLTDLEIVKGASRLIVTGASVGSIAAIRLGLNVQAEKIVCFAGVTTLKDKHRNVLGDTRQKSLTRKINKVANHNDLDTKEHIEKDSEKSNIHMYFGENMNIDRLHAERLSSFKNVHIQEVLDTASHDIVTELVIRNKFVEILD